MLKEKTKELVKETEALFEDYMKMFGMDELMDIEPEQFAVLQRGMKLMDKSMKLCVSQAEAIDDINKKLDVLLKRK